MREYNKTFLPFFLCVTILYLVQHVESSINFIAKDTQIVQLDTITNSQENNKNNTVKHLNCNYENCPFSQGVCYENKCICGYGFKTFESEGEQTISCNYKQKSSMTAFFLEFFFPFGLGHYYAGKITLAVIKLCLFMVFFFNFCGELFCMNLHLYKLVICSTFILLADVCLWTTLQFIDLICYALGFYLDGNGIPMI